MITAAVLQCDAALKGNDRNELVGKIIDDKMNGFPLRRVYNELTGELLYNLLVAEDIF